MKNYIFFVSFILIVKLKLSESFEVEQMTLLGKLDLKNIKYGNIYFFKINIPAKDVKKIDFEIRISKDSTFDIDKCKDIKISAHSFDKKFKDEAIGNFSNFTNISLKCSRIKYELSNYMQPNSIEYKSIVAKIQSKIKWKVNEYVYIKLITNFEEYSISVYINQVYEEEEKRTNMQPIMEKTMIILGVIFVLVWTMVLCKKCIKKSENDSAQENNISNDPNNHEENILPEEQ